MKKTLAFALIMTCTFASHGQRLAQVTFNNASDLAYFSLITDQGVMIRIDPQGKVLEWGTEMMSRYGGYYSPRLQPFPGRIEYFGPESDSISRGKLRSIGTTSFTYYGSYENESKVGKLRTAGTLIFDYFSNYDNAILKGKIRSIGNMNLDYYSSFDEETLRGKLKTVSNTSIVYYTSFDDKLIRGLVKSIGPLNYTWYTSLDLHASRGALKTGYYRQIVGSVTYILREGQ
jgi:hypothetical protein